MDQPPPQGGQFVRVPLQRSLFGPHQLASQAGRHCWQMPPSQATPPFVTYTWDTGTHLVTLTAVCSDRERFGTLDGALDELAGSIRVADELTGGESPEVLRLGPA